MGLVHKWLGVRSATENPEPDKAADASARPSSPEFRVLNRDRPSSVRGLAPDSEPRSSVQGVAFATCVSAHHDLNTALERARQEYERTFDNLVVVSETGDVLLELGLE